MLNATVKSTAAVYLFIIYFFILSLLGFFLQFRLLEDILFKTVSRMQSEFTGENRDNALLKSILI